MKIIESQFFDSPHRGQGSHHLIIPKADHASTGSAQAPQPQRGRHLLPPFVFLFLQIVDIAVYFNYQSRLMAVKIDNKSRNDLLPPKMDSQFIRP